MRIIPQTMWSHQLKHSSPFTRWLIHLISDFWGAKFTKMGDSLPWTPMNRRAKFDATSFILSEEIHNHTNKKHANSNRYIHILPVGMCE